MYINSNSRQKKLAYMSGILSALILIWPCAPIFALPSMDEVLSGAATFETSQDGSTLNITASDQSIIQYNSFDIAAHETVNFILPSADSFSLNRILGEGVSNIFGQLTSNGNLILVNQNGFHFGAQAAVQAQGLIASAHDIGNENFLAGLYRFAGLDNLQSSQTSILNEGTIRANEGGMAVLVADAIENRGTLEAPVGTVSLAAGKTVTVDISGQGLVSVAISEETSHQITDKDGNTVADQIKNSGTLSAVSGKVELNARSIDAIFTNAINVEGVIDTEIAIVGGDEATRTALAQNIKASGTINASREIWMGAKADMEISGTYAAPAGSVTFDAGRDLRVTASTNTEGRTTFKAKNNVQVQADITTDSGDLTLHADSDLNGEGAYLQAQGTTVETTTSGDITIASSGESTLANIVASGDLILKQAGASVTYTQHEGSTVQTGGSLKINAGATLSASDTTYEIAEHWINLGTFDAGLSLVKLVGPLPATVYGSNTFHDFQVIQAGKTVQFEAGQEQEIVGTLTLQGGFGNPMVLRSTQAGISWQINAVGITTMHYLDVMDSTNVNIHGPPLLAQHSKNSLNNSGWQFADVVWVGPSIDHSPQTIENAMDYGPSTMDYRWSNPVNWDGGFVPGAGDVVRFTSIDHSPQSTENSMDYRLSTVDSLFAGTIAGLIVESSYAGIISFERNLTATGDITISGGTLTGTDIILQAGNTLLVSSTIDASNPTPGGIGGTIHLLGHQVGVLAGAYLNVSGDAGGGTILIGGDYLGGGDTPTANSTIVQAGSFIQANAIHSGNGGKVIVWSNHYTLFAGAIEAKAEGETGDGGFVETSSKEILIATGTVDASAANGLGGEWLLDPNNITINTTANANVSSSGVDPVVWDTTNDSAVVTVASILASLNSGTSVTIQTGIAGANTQAGNITVASAIAKTAGADATLTLKAHENIIVNAAISSTSNKLHVLLQADSDGNSSGYINIAAGITSNGGNITMGGGAGVISAGNGYAVGNAGLVIGVNINNVAVAAGGGNIIVNGRGFNTTTNNNYGVQVTGASGAITSTGAGTITISGQGGGGSNDSGTNRGVFVNNGGVISTVDGILTISNTSGGGAGAGANNFGLYVTDANSTIKTTGSGNISVIATGGNANGSGGNNIGVFCDTANCIQSTGTGTITINGTGGNGAGSGTFNVGVYVLGSISGGGAAMNITGTGGASSGGSNYGVLVSGATAVISNIGTGTLTINGQGGGTVNSGTNQGVALSAAGVITTVNGSLSVTGTGGGAGVGINNYGIHITGGSGITSTGSASVTLTGVRGGGDAASNYGFATSAGTNTVGGASATGDITLTADTLSLAASTVIQTTGNVTVKPYTAATTVGVGAGAGTLTWTTTYLGYLTWGTAAAGKSLTIGSTAAGDITINTASTILDKNVTFISGGNILLATTALAHAGANASTLTMQAYGNITISSAITAAGSALTVLLQSDYDANSSGYINIAAGITSNGGNITMGGGSGVISAGNGYAVGNAGQVIGVNINNVTVAAGGGNIIVNGRGFNTTTNNNYGVIVNGASAVISTTGTGTITVSGQGGGGSNDSGSNYGVYLPSGGVISTVDGNLTINNTTGGGAGTGIQNYGVYVSSGTSTIKTTGSGNISITATGGNANGSGGSNYGVHCNVANCIQTTGTGMITINGMGGNGAGSGGSNHGIFVVGSITGSGGAMNITGTGGASTGNSNAGVFLSGASAIISNTGIGTLAINGQGGGSGNSGSNYGVLVFNGGLISTVNGSLSVTGTGGGAGIGIDNYGVYILNGSGITSTGSAPITITGIRGNGDAATNYGFVTLTGTNTVGGASATGNITITADTLTLAASTVIQTTGNVTVKPYIATTTVGVGAGAGTLAWTDTYLGYLTWGTAAAGKSLSIGSATAGNITINTASTILDKNVTFISGGNITLATTTLAHAGANASTLTMQAYGNITISSAITAVGSALTVLLQSDYDANSSGYINIAAGITSNGGNITLGGGSGVISAGSGYAVGNAGQVIGVLINNIAVAAGGGNIIINGRGFNTTTNNNYGVHVTGATGALTTIGTGTITVSGQGGGASVNSGSNIGVRVDSGSVISSVDGNLTINNTSGGGAGTGTSNYGVYVLNANSTIKTTGSGNISVTATGGNGTGSGISNHGVFCNVVNCIQTTGSGTITINGTGGNGSGSGDSNVGVYVAGSITGSGGAMNITGTGGASSGNTNYGVLLDSASGAISNTGTGMLTISGQGGGSGNSAGNRGVLLSNGAVISTGEGSLLVTGIGGGAGTGTSNNGVAINIGSGIASTGTGTITINGTGGNGSGSGTSNHGVYVDGSIAGAGGAMNITGTGGASSGNGNQGVRVAGASAVISNTSIGTLTIIGQGGGSGNSGTNYGVGVFNGGVISTVNGTLSVTGTGGGAGTGTNNYGVNIENGSGITSTGSGDITITGIRGGGDTSNNYGFRTLTGTNTVGGASATGNITLTADTLSLAASTVIQTTGNVTVKPYTAATTIGVGAGAGTLTWTDTYLGYLTWGTAAAGKSLTIGSTAAGDITINTASTILDKNVTFISGGNISLATTALAHAGANASTLTMQAYGNITISSAITAAGSALTVLLHSDYDNNLVGTINITAGITSNSGIVTIQGGGGTINTVTPFDHLIINTAGRTVTLGAALDVNGNLTISAGTLDVDVNNDYQINVGGNWTNNGTFNAHQGTVVFDGVNQSITGSSTFFNFTKIAAGASTLTFDNTSTTTILGTMRLEGASPSARLLLRSDLPGQLWDIDPQGTKVAQFLDVQDSNNINANIFCTNGCLDSLRNLRWIFVMPESLASGILSPVVEAALSSVFNTAANAFSEFLVPTVYAEESAAAGSPFAEMNANELTHYFYTSPDVWTSFQTEAVAAEIVSETILYEGKVVTGLTYTNAQGSAAQQLIILEPGQKSVVSGLAKPSSSDFGAVSYLPYVLADPKPWLLSHQLLVECRHSGLSYDKCFVALEGKA